MNKINFGKYLVILIAILCVIFIARAFNQKTNPIACTLEAKICSDGSSVGRIGPKCEFSPCPLSVGGKIFDDSKLGITFEYPEIIDTEYITAESWPPIVTRPFGIFSCTDSGSKTTPQGESIKVNMDGGTYCIKTEASGAAGSTYTTYNYLTTKEGKLINLAFTLKSVQCMNYDEPKKSKCLSERQIFNPDIIVLGIVKNLRFK
jgi:hypothetical protein